ncbi:MAG: Uncharacterised protein [Flavobacterium sp. SCGC AAA160-P02]|nr:MAG: Uncharacterised protein [Flavobacterium sp. SCGC AAA160-P02]|tara:strand:- start:213 stop:347 length:135 start_codon:yes stop_codon:yes gene_type:complete
MVIEYFECKAGVIITVASFVTDGFSVALTNPKNETIKNKNFLIT